jgi:hypothetical protein
MGYGDQIPPEKVRQNGQAGLGPITKLGGLDPETAGPVLLELPREIFNPLPVKNLMPQRPKDRPDGIAKARPEGGGPQGMNGRAILAAIFDRPDRLDEPLEIAGNVAVNPDTSPLAPRTSPRTRPGITPAFFRQPLYIDPKMDYQ